MHQDSQVSRRRLLVATGLAGVGLLSAQPVLATGLADGDVIVPATPEGKKICQDRFLPQELQIAALKAAFKEDRKNDVQGLLTNMGEVRSPDMSLGIDPLRAAIYYGKKWVQNRELKVGFMGGSDAVRKKIQKYAEMWHGVVNVRFLFGKPGPHEIRIAFNPAAGSSSYMGTDNLVIPSNQPTMNYSWVTDDSTVDSDRAVVLHEFGHALGMIHEHQSPAGMIPWNRPVVIAAMWESAGWSAADVEQQIFRRYTMSQTQFTRLDRTSIMMYAFPKEWTTDGTSTPWNSNLSQLDTDFMKSQYPNA